VIPDKAFAQRATVESRKNRTHPTGKGVSGYTALHLRKQPGSQKCSLFSGWPLYETQEWVGVGVHSFWSPGECRCKQFAFAPWANHTPSPGAQSAAQAVT